jgi:hypothetical protein
LAASGDLTFAQGQPDGVEPFCILFASSKERYGDHPVSSFNEVDRDFRRVAAFMNEFDGFSDHRVVCRIKRRRAQ